MNKKKLSHSSLNSSITSVLAALLCILIVRGIFFRCHFPGNIMQSLLHIVFNFRFKIGNNMDILPTVLAVKRTFFHFRPAIRTLHTIILLLPAKKRIPDNYSSAWLWSWVLRHREPG